MGAGTPFFGTWKFDGPEGLRGSLTFEGEDGKGAFRFGGHSGELRCEYTKSTTGTPLVHFELADPDYDGAAIGSGYASVSTAGLLVGLAELNGAETSFTAKRLPDPPRSRRGCARS